MFCSYSLANLTFPELEELLDGRQISYHIPLTMFMFTTKMSSEMPVDWLWMDGLGRTVKVAICRLLGDK